MTPSLLLALVSWSPVASAEDAPEVALATPIEVAGLVAQVRRESGSPVLVGAAGPDAERIALKVAEALPPGEVRVLRVGTIGDDAAEMRGALDKSGLRCGIRLGITSAQTYTATTYGTCSSLGSAAPSSVPEAARGTKAPATASPAAPSHASASPATASPAAASPATASAKAPPGTSSPAAAPPAKTASSAPVAPSPTPASPPSPGASPVASIPGAGAALSPGATGVPSTPVPYLVAPPPPPETTILQSTYDAVALRRARNPNPRDAYPDATWIIRDGRGRTLSAVDFARRVGDSATERRMSRELGNGKTLGAGLAIGGGVLAVAGLGLLLARDYGAPDRSDFDVDIQDYDTNEEYFEAVAQSEADFRAAEDAHEIVTDDRAWIAGFLAGSGVLAIGVSPLASRGAADHRAIPALYWTREQADALILAHNKAVRQKIGLPEPEAPTAAVIEVPTPPKEEEELDSEDPPEDAAGDPPEDHTPEPQRAPEQEKPSPEVPSQPSGRAPGLRITPVLGVGWTGLVGSF